MKVNTRIFASRCVVGGWLFGISAATPTTITKR